MEQYIFGQIRLQVINNSVVRVEKSVNGKFFDENTFLIPNRKEACCENEHSTVTNDGVVVGDYTIRLPANANALTDVEVCK